MSQPQRILVAPLLIALLAVTAGCDSIFGPGEPEGPVHIEALPRSLSAAEVEAIQASNAFGFDLLRETAGEDPRSSVFLSPLSASMALGMALNGAAGETYEDMRSTLRFDALSEEEINASYRGLLDLLTVLDSGVEISVGNAIWFREGLALRDDFGERVRSAFDAHVEPLDFGDAGSAVTINDWVRDATQERIDEMAQAPFPENQAVLLMNAVYFKADWTLPFDAARTREAPFHLADGSTGPIDLMVQSDTFGYVRGEGFAAVDLPYGGQAFAMTVVVPGEGASVEGFLHDLDVDAWAEITDGMRTEYVEVGLPRFELEWEAVLNGHLDAMGMGAALQSGADFSRMFRDAAPWIDEVKQKTFVRVDEVGTEAAAATGGSLPDATPAVHADRPFVFAIRERLTGTILFVGVIAEPPPGI